MFKFIEKRRSINTRFVDYIEGKIDNPTFWNEYKSNPLYRKQIACVAKRKKFGYIDEFDIAHQKENHVDFFCIAVLQNSIDNYLTYKKIPHSFHQIEGVLLNKWDEFIPPFLSGFVPAYHLLEKTYGEEVHSKKFYRENLLKIFKCEKYPPRWLQFCEWPYDGEEPCLFLFQDGFPNQHDFINYHFRKMDDSEIIVSQYD